MSIHIAETDAEITACFPVMQQLRTHLGESEFVACVREQEGQGYKLAFMDEGAGVVAVAGFRIGHNLAWGRFLYVDDLVVASARRSGGCGAKILAWLRDYAISMSCSQLHLDSGMQRRDAHRFYEREGMAKAGFHFVETLSR